MKKPLIRIATRKSPLAWWQANDVKNKLIAIYPSLQVELLGILTQADKMPSASLIEMGGKGLFVKELEIALLENEADIAVHSIKDLPAELPDELILDVICERDDPRDALVSNHYESVFTLPPNAIVGTSSLRRQCQLKALRPDLQMEVLRGNVGTRLAKLDEGKFDAIILAAAGLKRLNLTDRIREYFNPQQFIPAIGQGAIGIECRKKDILTRELIAVLNHQLTRYCITAERSMNQVFGGNCQIPLAAYAILSNHELQLDGLVGKPDGSIILRSHKKAALDNPEKLGKMVAEDLLSQGAGEILNPLPITRGRENI